MHILHLPAIDFTTNCSSQPRQYMSMEMAFIVFFTYLVTGRKSLVCRDLLSFLYSYCQRRVLGSRGLLVVYFTSTKSPRGPPWNEGHWPKVRHETSVFEVPAQEQHEHSFTLVLLICLLHVLCTWYAGIAHHRVLQTSG